MQTFDSGGMRLACIDEGPRDGAAVLLIHGFASNMRFNWINPGWVRTLTEAGFRVAAFDNRGHGESARPHAPEAYGARTMAEDARACLDHLGIQQADVMGYSMGARITAFLASAHPDRVRSAIFGGLGGNMIRPMAGTGAIAHALEAASIDDVTNPTARTFRAFAEQTRSDLAALAACIRSSREPITREMLAGFRCPVLVAVGEKDVIGGPAADLAALIPGAVPFVIAGRDHMQAVGDKTYKQAVVEFLGARVPRNA